MKSISISSIKAFKKCRRQFEFSSSTRLNLEPTEPSLPFFTGSVIHTALEGYYGFGMDITAALEAAITIERARLREIGVHSGYDDQLNEQIVFCQQMIAHYKQWVDGKIHATLDFSDQNLEFISVEEAFTVPFYTRSGRKSTYVNFNGRFDGIVRHIPTGDLYLWEIKTSSRPAELIATLDNDEQAGSYIYAASEMIGQPIAGVIYNILWKKNPTQAKRVTGGLTLDKRLSTSFDAYLAAIRVEHPEWEDDQILARYGERLSALRLENKFFQRIIIRRTETELTNLMGNLYEAGKEALRESTPMYPTPAFNTCKWCRFKVPCLQMEAGIDPKPYLVENFKVREKRILTGAKMGVVRFEPVGNGKGVFVLGNAFTEALPYYEGLLVTIQGLVQAGYYVEKEGAEFIAEFLQSNFCEEVDLYAKVEELLNALKD